MATSKTLTPTNVTISIPEFTDQPDQRVNSNCIDKEADAINKINTEATNTNIGSFATLAGLATLLDTMLGNMQSAGVKSFQTNATATVDPFVSGLTYMGTIFKSASNTTFSYVELRPISENKKIIGRRQSGGGYTWEELVPNSKLPTIDIGRSNATVTLANCTGTITSSFYYHQKAGTIMFEGRIKISSFARTGSNPGFSVSLPSGLKVKNAFVCNVGYMMSNAQPNRLNEMVCATAQVNDTAISIYTTESNTNMSNTDAAWFMVFPFFIEYK